MKIRLLIFAAVLVAGAPLAHAETLSLCKDDLDQDRQATFTREAFDCPSDPTASCNNLGAVEITSDSPPKLQLNTNLAPFNPEQIVLPFEQELSVSYLFESAGASATMGYFYYDDLISRNYVNVNDPNDPLDDTLRDNDSNGIADFYEDLFNMSLTRYVGKAGDRRCNKTFSHGGFQYYEPEIAKSACGTTTYNGSNRVGETGSYGSDRYSDKGLFPRMPNLLEPADPENDFKGIGHLVFLLGDDDGDTTYWQNLPIVADSSTSDNNGVPDYDTSAYDANGRLVPTNPDPGIHLSDRTVNLGTLPGNREFVFFLVVYYDGGNWMCLKPNGTNCNLELRSPISIFFSKSFLNLDLETTGNNPIVRRDIGCNYGGSCNVGGSWYDGWLDGPALSRLAGAPFYLNMPHEVVSVPRRAHNKMPHVFVGAPSTDPLRWVLGFEDLVKGGDRDFNDISFLINKKNGGTIRSATVSNDLSPEISEDFTITKVRFKRQDDVTRQAWTEVSGHPGACNGPPAAAIDYFVAVDCRTCTSDCGTASAVYTSNPSPHWVPVTFPVTSPPTQEVTLDMLALGFTGSQLCWRAVIQSPNEFCRPVIDNVDVGYQAVKSGDYSRAALSALGNAIVYGTFEAPGLSLSPAPSTRAYDGRKDMSLRGHLYMKTLYDPDDTSHNDIQLRWDAGQSLSTLVAGGSNLEDERKVYTTNAAGDRIKLKDAIKNDVSSPAFPDSLCTLTAGGRYLYDLNNDGSCTLANVNANDRGFLRRWLYGWENRYPSSGSAQPRAWPLGGINMSTAAVISPPGFPSWWFKVPPVEADAFKTNFQSKNEIRNRDTIAYVGTTTGFLHAFDTGRFKYADDPCTGERESRGFFEHEHACNADRKYGTGDELFAYAPRKLLSKYIHNYVNYVPGGFNQGATMDASPAVADVDLGFTSGSHHPWERAANDDRSQGSKTVLAMATGPKNPVFFALDITRPDDSHYPLPMWELDVSSDTFAGSGSVGADTIAGHFNVGGAPYLPDTKGSRHSPSIGKVAFGGGIGDRWVAVFPTDYAPASGSVGTVYFIDLATGAPVALTPSNSRKKLLAGVVTLAEDSTDVDEGIGGEAALADTNSDGLIDVVYVPSTSGKIYRINVSDVDPSRDLGKVISSCVVADIPVDLHDNASLSTAEAAKQRIYSNLALKLLESGSGTTVRIFVGTANDPDDPFDAEASNYYVLAYEDASPLTSATCGANLAWHKQLDAGQVVWGGVTANADQVFAATAVGDAADACNLDDNDSGKAYAFNGGSGDPAAGSGSDLGGHAVSPPVIHDQHVFIVTADGKVRGGGNEQWNNPVGVSGPPGTGILLWDVSRDGRVDQ